MSDKVKSHFHITISGITDNELLAIAKACKCKATNIDLVTSKGIIRDRMITGYQLGICNKKVKEISNIIKSMGFNVKRIKLEADLLSYIKHIGKPNFSKYYIETHFHIKSKNEVSGNFVFSSNPYSNGKIFANYRGYSLSDMDYIINYTKNKGNVHLELCILDTNKDHDLDWWMS